MIERRCFLALFILALTGCTAMRSGSSCTVEDAYFSSHRTFAWSDDFARVTKDPLDAIAPVTLEQIRAEISAQLQTLGFIVTDNVHSADVMVSFVVATRQEYMGTTYVDYYPWWGVHRYPVLVQYQGRKASEAFLAIDLQESMTGRPLWRGWAEKSVSPSDRRASEVIIKEAVASILTHLPAPFDRSTFLSSADREG